MTAKLPAFKKRAAAKYPAIRTGLNGLTIALRTELVCIIREPVFEGLRHWGDGEGSYWVAPVGPTGELGPMRMEYITHLQIQQGRALVQ